LLVEDEIDLLAAALPEGRDHLPNRRVFLGIETLLPPHDEVGGLGAQRRQNERQSNENGAAIHHRSSLK
jgi:hypothetical protein